MYPSFYRFKSPELLRKFIESASSQTSAPVSGSIDSDTVGDPWDEWFQGISSDESETTPPTPSSSKTGKNDPVEHPPHYTQHPSGVECIDIIEHFNFCRGSALKYIWRAGEKNDELEDLKKARWCLDREIKRITQASRPYLQ